MSGPQGQQMQTVVIQAQGSRPVEGEREQVQQARREEVLRLLDEHEQYERSLRKAGAAENGEA